FFVNPDLHNDTERQIHILITTYREDFGLGFRRTFFDLFTALSACFPLLCMLAALTLGYLLWKKVPSDLMKGILLITVLVFGVCFVIMIVFTFIFPIVMTALVFVTLLVAYLLCPRSASS